MVKEWDFEAGIFFKKSKRIKYPTLFYVLWPLLAFFSVIHGVSLQQNWLKNATNDISIQEFHNINRHYVYDTMTLIYTIYIKGVSTNMVFA
jgi:hypothetical protein